VPAFIGVALCLVVIAPRLPPGLAAGGSGSGAGARRARTLGVYGSGVYGGYFGAAQGILLLAILGIGSDADLQRINALKIVLAMLVNAVAGILFIVATDIAWLPAGLIAAGSIVGGQLGAGVGRRLPPALLRVVIVLVGISAILELVLR
jgi:uncharacterized membrane protein YfcA